MWVTGLEEEDVHEIDEAVAGRQWRVPRTRQVTQLTRTLLITP